jgi:hypothetical protein
MSIKIIIEFNGERITIDKDLDSNESSTDELIKALHKGLRVAKADQFNHEASS